MEFVSIHLEFVSYWSRKIGNLRLVIHGYKRFWEKTKNDDSEVGEKNLVDDTRFLRR